MSNLDFPILNQRINERPLIYLDSAATTQKPQSVLDAVNRFYQSDNAGAHRGVHELSMRATEAYEAVREQVRGFIHAEDKREIVFVPSTTEGINLVAQSFGQVFVREGDEIVVSAMEHHSNIVPWQMLCKQRGATLRVIPISDEGELDMLAFDALLNDRTKMVAVTHVSNVLGTVNPVKQIVERAHQNGTPVLIDGAQAIAHMPVDVRDLDCDFYVFSGHKMYAPLGAGVVFGKKEWLEQMPPYQGGGGMISRVTFEGTDYAEVPHKFEAGTPNVAAVVGLGAAIDYLTSVGFETILSHENQLLGYTSEALGAISDVRIIGRPPRRVAAISFVIDSVHPHDIGTILDHGGVAVRVGHHCCMPLMDRLGLPATVRVSFGVYNRIQDVDALIRGLEGVKRMFGV